MDPLIQATIDGNSPRVRQLLQQGTHPDICDSHGETALTWAAHLGHTDVVKDLLAAGANREARGSILKGTPLLLAACGGHRGIVALLAVFAKLNVHDSRGASALMLAIEQPDGIVKPQRRILGILGTLINAGIDLDLQDYEGNTALMWAIRWRNLDALRLLLSSGANPYLKNDAGQTALQIADESGDKDIVQILHTAGVLE